MRVNNPKAHTKERKDAKLDNAGLGLTALRLCAFA